MYEYYYILFVEYPLDARKGTKVFNRLPVLRAERGLSRQDLATALGISYQTVGYLERGEYNPSLELVLRISEHFELPVEAIFSKAPFRPLSEGLYGPRHDNSNEKGGEGWIRK